MNPNIHAAQSAINGLAASHDAQVASLNNRLVSKDAEIAELNRQLKQARQERDEAISEANAVNRGRGGRDFRGGLFGFDRAVRAIQDEARLAQARGVRK